MLPEKQGERAGDCGNARPPAVGAGPRPETLPVKRARVCRALAPGLPAGADTGLSGARFLLIQTKWLPGIVFSSNSYFSYLQG